MGKRLASSCEARPYNDKRVGQRQEWFQARFARLMDIAPHSNSGSGEASDGFRFVVINLEYGIEFRDLKEVFDALGKTDQLKGAAMVGDGGKSGN